MQTHTLHGSVGRCSVSYIQDKSRQQRRSAATAADAHRWSARRGKPGLLVCYCLHSSRSISRAVAEDNKMQSTLSCKLDLGRLCPSTETFLCLQSLSSKSAAILSRCYHCMHYSWQVEIKLIRYDRPSHSLQSGRALLCVATSTGLGTVLIVNA